MLLALVRAAEDGGRRPQIRVVTQAGDLIVGTPMPAVAFVDAMETGIVAEWSQYLQAQPRTDRKNETRDAAQLGSDSMASLRDAAGVAEDVLTLAPARIAWSGRSDGVDLPAIRVPVSAVAAWWVCGGKEFKAPAGFGIGVGAFIPIGD
ncbi:MAG: hypothetical protein JWO02_123 [Solirubrobacterales bacterium]|nr:hypothetical protein [Solirubrobacterales bacterium]